MNLKQVSKKSIAELQTNDLIDSLYINMVMEKNNLEGIHWQEELKSTAFKYHRIGIWVAIFFNLLFFVTDYINLPAHWIDFLMFRCCVSFTTLIAFLLRKKIRLSPEILIFIPVLLISVQNAYMWSFMNNTELQKHAFAYIALFIGSGMLILWKNYYSYILIGISIPANVIFFLANSSLTLEEILANGGLLTGAVMVFSIFLIQTRYNLTKKEIIARLSLEESYKQLNKQKEIIESKNKSIVDSINYAKRIQNAILPSDTLLTKYLPHHFILFKPRDIVSGDFYWFGHKENKSILIAADCTGHGVPGAFMSMIGNSLLNKLIVDFNQVDPADLLFQLRKEVIRAVSQGEDGTETKDGMDLALCLIDHDTNLIKYAGAFNPLYIVRDSKVIVTKADKMPIGRYFRKDDSPFTNHIIQLEEGDTVYLFSDGYPDQFGGVDNRKIGSKRFKQLLSSMGDETMLNQKEILDTYFNKWKEGYNQIDDVLVIGFRLN